MSINRFNIPIIVAIVCIFQACKQSEPPEIKIPERKGSLYFSGYYFNYKNTPNPVGPGPNRFKGTTDYAWVDANDKLHLKIAKNPSNNFWYCSEIISVKQFGYGTYIMTCETDIRNFDAKTVFGCFTWDDYSFQKQGNSEVDIEFAKWGNDADTLLVTYSAQPVIFSNPVAYNERTHKPLIATKYISKPMTYMMKWTPDSVFWESYEGETYPGTNKVSTWSFNKNNTPRQKIEGDKTSDFIVIPAPGDSTNLRFNFWLLNGQAPNNAKEHEIVIKNFKYIPL
ncbi:MAG: hypothetical protein ACK455_01415 [Bacteroidota bacterium]